MVDLELDSFYVKFKNLLYSGKAANLKLEKFSWYFPLTLVLFMEDIVIYTHRGLEMVRQGNVVERNVRQITLKKNMKKYKIRNLLKKELVMLRNK